jgi:hypothetical protein
MRRLRRLSLLVGALAIGCGTGDDDGTSPPVIDAGARPDSAGISDGTTGAVDVAAASIAYVRLAAWSPDAPPLDFCLGDADAGAFFGPLLSTAFATDGGPPAIPFPSSSAYMGVPAGVFDARVVGAGATTCDQGLGFDARGVVLSPSQRSTLALEGRSPAPAGASLRVVAMGDDTDVRIGTLAFRFVDADPAADPATLTFSPPQAIPSETAPFAGAPPSDAGLDRNGYVALAALSAVNVGVIGPGNVTAAQSTITGAVGSVISVILLPNAADAGAATDASATLLECIDNAGTVGLFANCNALP